MSGNTAMSKTQVQLKSLADLLESKRGSLNALVANGLKPDRLIKVVVAAASKTPRLPTSSFRSAHRNARCGPTIRVSWFVELPTFSSSSPSAALRCPGTRFLDS